MKKIPTIFKREFRDDGTFTLLNELADGLDETYLKSCIATVKWDGTPVMYDGKAWYKRFDLKPGRTLPEGAIPCQEAADPVTKHFPHWVPVTDAPSDKHLIEAIRNYEKWGSAQIAIGTYEAIGPHIQGNPYELNYNYLKYHGRDVMSDHSIEFTNLRSLLTETVIEGIVWWKDGKPVCKLKRTDFGLPWPVKGF